MNLSNRIRLAYLVAILLIVTVGLLSFFYLNKVNVNIHQIIEEDLLLLQSGDRVANHLEELKKQQIEIQSKEEVDPLLNEVKRLLKTIRANQEITLREINKKRYQDMIGHIESYNKRLEEARVEGDFDRSLRKDLFKVTRQMESLATDIMKTLGDELESHRQATRIIISDVQRQMILILAICLFTALLLGFLTPKIIQAPFRKMLGAIEQIRNLNYDVRVPISSDDELGELGRSINKMINQLQNFDERKIRRIAFEQRRFNTLAESTQSGVVLVSKERKVEYINNQLFTFFLIDSEQVIGKLIEEVPFHDVLKREIISVLGSREKVREKLIPFEITGPKGKKMTVEISMNADFIRAYDGEIVDFLFTLEIQAAKEWRSFLSPQDE